MVDTKFWTIDDYLKHYSGNKFSKESTTDLLQNILQSQKDYSKGDPAWISLISPSNLSSQIDYLYSIPNYQTLPLFGVPIAVKDNIDFEYLPTTAACPSYEYKPSKDSTTVSLLRKQGCIVIGKTNLDQFATGLVGCRSPYGKTTSVFSDKHVSGGSSAGSANVVGRGIVPISLGTDTAGSGRVPAALNNLIGLKPTRGIFSCSGVVPACKSLDTVSIFAHCLKDAEAALKTMIHFDPENDEYSRPMPANPLLKFDPSATVVGIPKEVPFFEQKEDNLPLYENAIKSIERAGFKTQRIDFTPFLDLAKCLYEGAWVAERYDAVRDFLKTNPSKESLDPTVLQIIKSAEKFDAADAFHYEYKRQGYLQQIKKIFKETGIEVLAVPTCPLNPTLQDLVEEPIKVNSIQGTWTNFVNLADLAALAVPSGFRKSDGLPQGITFIGPTFSDYALLDLASKYFKVHYPNQSRTSGSNVECFLPESLDNIQGPPLPCKESYVPIAVVGAHLKGLPLHWQLEKCNAQFITATKTAANYKLYALPKNGPILKPGLCKVDKEGSKIEVEVYAIPKEHVGQFLNYIPEPLGLGTLLLEDGSTVKGFICEENGYKQNGSVDITSFGGFKAYVKTLDHDKVEVAKNQIPQTVDSFDKPFNTVLVANRGEIAVRIIKTLKKLNITSVAVYSDLDKYAEHVTLADVKVPLNGVSAADTYINVEKIITAAKDTNSDAIIPGYGFLSENADFSDRCGKEGIVFVGPSGDAIRKLGLKHSAREIAEKAKVPLVPGSGLISSASEAKIVAESLGYPVMVKSTAGGGGIGLQKVDSPKDIENVFETVQHQGKSFFGDGGVFLERFVENARHIEIQMLGDGKGNAIAIGERDCSLQRRNQKIIEETPAPNLPATTRQKMIDAAESLASVLKYKCAGTVEYIYDSARDEFYFLEVNARLQVEHPVTELVTNVDLVEWMLRIAADNPPSFDRSKIKPVGASMEARLYAENPAKGFRPSPGQLTEVHFPEWARIDGWVKKGTEVSAEYDPTLAKIIVYGKDREECLANLNRALNETSVYGCITNIDYLRSVASSEMFAEAKMHTKILDSYDYEAKAIEVLSPGAYTTVQDYPGRTGYWRVGVPPSGPMDSYSHRLANRIVGNDYTAPAIEITLNGPKLKFLTDSLISLTGGEAEFTINDKAGEQNKPVFVRKNDIVSIGKLTKGCRAYLAIRNGLDIPEYLGSRSTFALGNMGGYNGRVLKVGDILFLNDPSLPSSKLAAPKYEPTVAPLELIPSIPDNKKWTIGVTCGPHGSPDFFTKESIDEFFSDEWKIHYNSNRFGVRLIGPKPKWARQNGGEGGLHPSNQHDYVYSVGAICFTGDFPVIIGPSDGPSLGGFVCQAVIPEGELWKVGQVKPGDSVKFVPLSYESARKLKESQDAVFEDLNPKALATLSDDLILPTPQDPVLKTIPGVDEYKPKVTFRQSGDRYILVEYGELEMNLNSSYRINRLIAKVEEEKTVGIVEMSQGVRSVLIEFDGYKISQSKLLNVLTTYESEIKFDKTWSIKSKKFRLPMAFEDSKTLECVTRYQETIRSTAPWLPNNVDFIADVNGLHRDAVKDMLYSASFMVLGLGDVYLGAPCAVPLDPRQRFIGSKYNPSRVYTKNGVVGLGGMYMCIYAMDSPGGYQLVGRTIPIWDKLMLNAHSENPWLLTPFDTVEFYLVSEEELEKNTADFEAGNFKVDYEETVFDHKLYCDWLEENKESIEAFKASQNGEKSEEFANMIAASEKELEKNGDNIKETVEEYPEDAVLVYSEFTGKLWKVIADANSEVNEGDRLVIIEAMKTEMVVSCPSDNLKVLKIMHKSGDMVEAGDLVAVLI
ncbi:probable Urea amidolyase [Hanseniaspora guilliermondii]|uniref:Probable Urea amidolyase n=1 Tax=Hanseniaspora guilliermondii TaxID=56406 RepID=A0A1L0B6C9_9ASCO|nr:probable Urea amidolyase [Hanseniaspora guilliermondii]